MSRKKPGSLGKFISVPLFLLIWQCSNAQVLITTTGNWNTVLPVASVTEAGNDFTSTYLSATDQVLINVSKNPGNSPYNWRVDVRKSDINWGSDLQLSIRRTGDGYAPNGNSFINGGTNFQLLTNTNQSFFNGRRDHLDVPIQFQLTGVSVLVPASTHTTTIIYTLTEL